MAHGAPSNKETDKLDIKKSSFFDKAPDIKKMPTFKVVAKLRIEDMEPWINTKAFLTSHEEAEYWEKQLFPEGYKRLKKLDESMDEDSLAGANDDKGNLFVSSVVPHKDREEVAYHEWVESLIRKAIKEHKKKVTI